MKKLICILFSLTVLVASIFADKSRFYEDGKVIDTMYVNSEEGLKIRDYPSLKSNRLCGLTHRFPVKIVAIGKEVTIDGIMAPWVEILIPRYEWKGEEPEFGWVFGGYLTKDLPAFKKPETASQFNQYLEDSYWEFAWEDGDSAIIRFGYFENGSIYLFENAHDSALFGTPRYKSHPIYGNVMVLTNYWTVSGNGIKTTGASFWGKVLPSSPMETEQFLLVPGKTFLEVTAYGMQAGVYDNDRPDLMEKIWWTFYANQFFLSTEEIMGEYYYFDSNTMLHDKRFYYQDGDGKNVLQNLEKEKKIEKDFALECIKSGVSAKGTKYEQQYHDYWNSIMEQHQKKADEMK